MALPAEGQPLIVTLAVPVQRDLDLAHTSEFVVLSKPPINITKCVLCYNLHVPDMKSDP